MGCVSSWVEIRVGGQVGPGGGVRRTLILVFHTCERRDAPRRRRGAALGWFSRLAWCAWGSGRPGRHLTSTDSGLLKWIFLSRRHCATLLLLPRHTYAALRRAPHSLHVQSKDRARAPPVRRRRTTCTTLPSKNPRARASGAGALLLSSQKTACARLGRRRTIVHLAPARLLCYVCGVPC